MQNHSTQNTKIIPITKALIPNKEWIVQFGNQKLGSIRRFRKEYKFVKNGNYVTVGSFEDVIQKFGISNLDNGLKKIKKEKVEATSFVIYGFLCSSKPYKSIYNIQKKLPLFAKSNKSKSWYCAGYYVIKFNKGWVKSFCPKLITLERYPYFGPYKTDQEMKEKFNNLSKLYEPA